MTLSSNTPNQTFNGVLQQCTLNAISFPVEYVEHDFGQVVVEHQFPHTDGSSLEAVKTQTRKFKVKALFLTSGSIRKPSWATWDADILYPKVFQQVYTTLQNLTNQTIPFVHPTLGTFQVKVIRGSTKVDHNMMNGQTIEFEVWEDTSQTTSDNALNTILTGAGQSAAQAFDNGFQTLLTTTIYDASDAVVPQVTAIPVDSEIDPNLLDISVSSLYATASTYNNTGPTFTTTLNVSFVPFAINQVESLQVNLNSLNLASTGSLQVQLENVIAGLYTIKQSQAALQASLSQFIVKIPMTLPACLLAINGLGNNITMEQLLAYNPSLNQSPLIPISTIVSYPTLNVQ